MSDPFSSISHLFGAVVFLVLGFLLLRRGRGNRTRLVFLGIYVGSCVLLFSMSGVYHMLDRGSTPRLVMQRVDHAAIFVLIAGTYTPAHGLLLRGWLRWAPLVLIWAAAGTGVVLKTVFFDELGGAFGLSMYLTLGWVGASSAVFLAWRYGFAFLQPLLVGGLAYSVGGVMDSLGWLVVVPGVIHPHEVFHLAVLTGALFHWLFVWQFASGEMPRRPRRTVPPAISRRYDRIAR